MDIGSAGGGIKRAFSELRERVSRLSSSERDVRAVRVGLAGLCLLIVYIVFHTFSSGTERLEKQVKQLETELVRIENLRSEYEGSKKRIEELSRRIKKENEPLISVVEQILLDENIDRKNFSIKDVNLRTAESEDFYEEKSIDVELKDLSLKDLVDILYKIQNTPSFLKVSNLNISTKFNKSDSMTVKLRVSTFEFRELG
ncbi:MAG: type 4a pilus biogenesis protein PilO [Thermodesulfobacteriota bacterium]